VARWGERTRPAAPAAEAAGAIVAEGAAAIVAEGPAAIAAEEAIVTD
jgi:hypothetical protein